MSTALGLSAVIPCGPFLSPAPAENTKSRSASPCPSESGASSRSSESGSLDKSSPSGLYVPVHRRGRAGSCSATSVSSSPRSSKAPLIDPNSRLISPHLDLDLDTKPPKPHPHPHPHPARSYYTRDELLSLAPTSLVQTSVHPIITPQLLAKHPRILRARGDGVARALEMSRRDCCDFAFARLGASASANENENVNVDVKVSECAKVHAQVRKIKSSPSDLCTLCTPIPIPIPTPNRPSRRTRGGRRRAQYQHQRNFALTITNSEADNANANANANTPAPDANANANANKTANLPTTTNKRRQLDVSVITSWRRGAPGPQARVVVA